MVGDSDITLELSLSGLEVVFLTDSIDNRDQAVGLDEQYAYLPLARKALLLLGSAYREVVTSEGIRPGPVELQVSEELVWLLRGKVKTGDLAIDGKTNVGISLLLKFYALLTCFNSGLADLPVAAVAEPSLSDEEMRALKEELNAGATIQNDRPNKDGGPDDVAREASEGGPREAVPGTEGASD